MAYCNYEVTDINGKPYVVLTGDTTIHHTHIILRWYYSGSYSGEYESITIKAYYIDQNPVFFNLAYYNNGLYSLREYAYNYIDSEGRERAIVYRPNYNFTLDWSPPAGPDKATSPTPADKAVNVNKNLTTLSWSVS